MATTKKSEPVKEAVILKQRYEGRCGGIAKYAECDTNVGVFESVEALYKFWQKNYKEPFCINNPFDPYCRRDGFYLERFPLVTENSNMKKMLSYMHPARAVRKEYSATDLL